jgi:hypothetical protein
VARAGTFDRSAVDASDSPVASGAAEGISAFFLGKLGPAPRRAFFLETGVPVLAYL